MQADKIKLSLGEVLYFAFFIILSIIKGLGIDEGGKVFALFVIAGLFWGTLKLLLTPYTRRQWVMLIILLLLMTLVYYNSGEKGILFVVFTLLGMKNISVDKVFRLGLWVWASCAVILIIWSFYRIEHTVYRVSDKLGLGYILRWSLGFTHPNILHITYFALCIYILYQLAERYDFRNFLLLMLGNALVFFYSISYTGFGIVTVLLIGGLYIKCRPRFCLLEKAAVNLILPLIVFTSFILPLIRLVPRYAEAIEKLNVLVSTRIYVASKYLVPECISPFGVKMSYLLQIHPYPFIDNSYIWAFIHYGVVSFVLFMCAYAVLIWDYTKKQKTRELLFIACFLGAGITEQLLFNTSFKNLTLLFLGELLFRQKEGEKEYYLAPGLYRKMENLLPAVTAKFSKWIWMPVELLSWVKAVWKSNRKQISAGIAAGALLGIILCGIFYHAPKGYVVPRQKTDWLEKTSVYLESSDDLAYEGYRIMDYQDADTPMQVLEGNAVTLETARYYVGSMMIGGLAGYLITVGIIILKDTRRQDVKT